MLFYSYIIRYIFNWGNQSNGQSKREKNIMQKQLSMASSMNGYIFRILYRIDSINPRRYEQTPSPLRESFGVPSYISLTFFTPCRQYIIASSWNFMVDCTQWMDVERDT